MAGGQERILRRRIKSVQSTKKITRAMELIAASRIVKAQARVQAARPYSEQITAVIANLASSGASSASPLLASRDEPGSVAFVVMTADRGLAGAYNSSVIRAAEHALRSEVAAGRDYSLVLVGRKALSYFRYRGYRIDAQFTGVSDLPTYDDARIVAASVMPRFEAGEIDRVQVVYTRFLSAGSQHVVEAQLMPVDTAQLAAGASSVVRPEGLAAAAYEFEPSPEVILETLLPRYVEARLFAAMLDAAASEHAARQRAMKAATDNADELIKSLARVMNRARQDAITTEIMEIVGGAEALRGGGRAPEEDLLADTIEDRGADLFVAHTEP